MGTLSRGRRLGDDVGKVRVGVAVSDPDGILATPLATVSRDLGAAGNDVRTLAQEIRGKIDAARPAVVAVAARSNGKASLIVAINGAAKSRGLSAADLVKGALSGRGGGNADLAQGGGVPADQVPGLLAAVEKAVTEAA